MRNAGDTVSRADALTAMYQKEGFERPRGGGWGALTGYLLAGVIGACAALVVVSVVVTGAFKGVPYLDRIDVASLFSSATPITIERTERVTVTEEERSAEVTARITPSIAGLYATADLTENAGGVLASAGAPRASATVLTSDGWLLSAGALGEKETGKLTIVFADGKPYAAAARMQDPATGLWFLKIDATTLVASAVRRDTASLGPGAPVYAASFRVGSAPLMAEQSVMSVVTLPHRDSDKLEARVRLAHPGNGLGLGSPVVTYAGEIAAVVSAIDQEGNVFAVPIGSIAGAMGDAFKNGALVRARTGMHYVELSNVADLAFALTHGRRQGALLLKNGTIPAVTPKSNADTAGLKEGDIIVKIEGELVREESDMATLLHSYPVASTVKLTVVRDGEERLVDLPLTPATQKTEKN